MSTDSSEDADLSLDELEIPEVWPSEGPSVTGISKRMVEASRPILVQLNPQDQGRLAEWLRGLVALRDAPMDFRKKGQAITREMARLPRLLPVLKAMSAAMAGTVKTHAWDDRSWGFRIGGGVATIAAATVGGKKAGLAMLGTAVAIPAWVVYGAGGVFAGMVIDELERLMAQSRSGSRGGPDGGGHPPAPPGSAFCRGSRTPPPSPDLPRRPSDFCPRPLPYWSCPRGMSRRGSCRTRSARRAIRTRANPRYPHSDSPPRGQSTSTERSSRWISLHGRERSTVRAWTR